MSRTTYERLKAFCEANNISMSQLVETRVNDFLGEGTVAITPRPTISPSSSSTTTTHHQPQRPTMSTPTKPSSGSSETAGYGHSSHSIGHAATIGAGSSASSAAGSGSAPQRPSAPVVPMTSAAARYAVEPPPPIIKREPETNAPKPAEKRADQIFTF